MPVNLHQPDELFEFLTHLGGRFTRPARIYLFGGSALLILGSPRNTADVDFSLVANEIDELRKAISKLAIELDVDWEESNPTEFMPLPAGYETRIN